MNEQDTQDIMEQEPKEEPKEPKWYVLHTYSGYENMVKENLVMVFKKNSLTERLFDITIPMEDVVEDKNGKHKIVQRKMFPSYVFIKMIYDNSMWHIITNTRGVTGFVGPQGRPLPLTPDEVKRMHLDKTSYDTSIKVGDRVKVTDGALQGFVGEVEMIDAENSKCRVNVSMFGRPTPVDLELYQIEAVIE